MKDKIWLFIQSNEALNMRAGGWSSLSKSLHWLVKLVCGVGWVGWERGWTGRHKFRWMNKKISKSSERWLWNFEVDYSIENKIFWSDMTHSRIENTGVADKKLVLTGNIVTQGMLWSVQSCNTGTHSGYFIIIQSGGSWDQHSGEQEAKNKIFLIFFIIFLILKIYINFQALAFETLKIIIP